MTKNYIDADHLEEIILRDLKKGTLSKEAKELLFTMITKISTKNCWSGYDEDTIGDMQLKAFDFINKYWKSYSKYRYIYTIYNTNTRNDNHVEVIKNLKTLKEFRRIRPKRPKDIHEKSKYYNKLYGDNYLVVSIIKDKIKLFEKQLDISGFKYDRDRVEGNVFSYFTQYIESAFKQTIKNSKFLYKKGVSSLHGEMTVYSLNKEEDYNPVLQESESNEVYNDIQVNNIVVDELKEVVRFEDVIYDRDIIIDEILINASDLKEVTDISYFYLTEGSKKNIKTIYNDQTLLYLLLQNNNDSRSSL